MKHLLRSQQGSAALIAVLGLLFLGGIGATTASIISKHEDSRTENMSAQQSYALAQAGIEYAKNRIDMGTNPAVVNYPMGSGGTFTVATVPNAGTIASTGTVGSTKKTLTLSTNFGSSCIDLDLSQAKSAAKNIVGMKLVKNCLTQATVTDWTISWIPDLGEKTDLLQVQGNQLYTLYNNPVGYASGTQISATAYTINGGNTPINKLEFTQNVPPGKSYTIIMKFSDGSSLSKNFVDPIGQTKPTPGYTINPDQGVTVDPNKTVTAEALCAEITYGANGPKIPVKAWLGIDNVYSTLYGGVAINGGEKYSTTVGAQAKKFTVKSNAKYGSFNATYMSTNGLQVKVLINGNTVPPLQGFGGQKPISACVQNYISPQGKAVLAPEQVLMLFELGTNMSQNPTSPAADFQDLVMLMTVK